MKLFKSIFLKIGYYISILLLIIVIVSFNKLYDNNFGDSIKLIKTWEKCDSSFISYEKKKMEYDSYEYFEYSVDVSIDINSNEYLNVHVYQFIKDCKYTNYSLVNENNIYDGTYEVLSENTCAIPKMISELYNLKIGDYLIINGSKQCEIKYIYNDIYSIVDVNLLNPINTVFIGYNTADIKEIKQYCNFNIEDDKPHNNIYSLTNIISKIKNNVMIYRIVFIILIFIISEILLLFRIKKEINSINLMVLNGDKKGIFYAIYFEGIYVFVPTLIISFILSIMNIYENMIILSFVELISIYIINSVIICINVRR